jgi:hypothetical protein
MAVLLEKVSSEKLFFFLEAKYIVEKVKQAHFLGTQLSKNKQCRIVYRTFYSNISYIFTQHVTNNKKKQ